MRACVRACVCVLGNKWVYLYVPIHLSFFHSSFSISCYTSCYYCLVLLWTRLGQFITVLLGRALIISIIIIT